MNKHFSNILNGVVGLTAATLLLGCAAETPFDTEGEGIIQLHTVVNAITTRSDDNLIESDYTKYLNEKCVVYITRRSEDEWKLIYQKIGLQNVESQIKLKSGSYVAEAWTGDSVSASYDKKFFRGYETFDVTKGCTSNVVLNCKIQNVVASINTTTIDPNLMQDDYTIIIKNSRGELIFDKNNAASEKAYFMMPNDDTSLEYTISGTRQDGEPFSKSGTIEDVKRTHEYILNFEYNPDGPIDTDRGAAFIKIHIKDEEITDSPIVTVHSRPTISGVECNIEKQLVYTSDDDIPESLSLQLCGFSGLSELAVTSESAAELGLPSETINLLKADEHLLQPYKNAGLQWTAPDYKESTKVATAFLTFPKSMLMKLSKDKETEHVINIKITDKDNPSKSTEAAIRIARNAEAIVIEDPIVLDKVDQNDPFSISSNSAILAFSLADDLEGTPGVEYSKENEDNWIFVPALTSANAPKHAPSKAAQKKYNVTLSGLEAGTAYKYRAACGGFDSENVINFTTYSKFIIPNGDMEKWAAIKTGGQDGVKVPSRTGSHDFWGNGNPGAKVAGEILTDESTDMFHSASKSAKLESKFASVMGIGKFAAGNLFAGEYVKTDGTDGVLSFGKPFADFADGKQVDVRPTAMRVYVNYRPKPGVNKKGANSSYIAEGQLDKAQIYVALTTAAIEIQTKKAAKLFNPEDKEVLAYGQATLEENYGADGQLKELIIPIEYFERSNGVLPTHLVIVCSASIYGDYFSGGEGSTMYLDDFELIYE